MCCGSGSPGIHRSYLHHGCCCSDVHGQPVHSCGTFWTREEKVSWLEKHLQELREQTKAVEERIAALKEE